MRNPDPLKPSPALLSKIGSIIIHTEEGLSDTGHPFDWRTVESLVNEEDVQVWLFEMAELALLPVTRSAKGTSVKK